MLTSEWVSSIFHTQDVVYSSAGKPIWLVDRSQSCSAVNAMNRIYWDSLSFSQPHNSHAAITACSSSTYPLSMIVNNHNRLDFRLLMLYTTAYNVWQYNNNHQWPVYLCTCHPTEYLFQENPTMHYRIVMAEEWAAKPSTNENLLHTGEAESPVIASNHSAKICRQKACKQFEQLRVEIS